MVSLLKDPAQLVWKVVMVPGETLNPGSNLYFVDVNFYGLEGFALYVRPIVAWANCQWKMLAKVNPLLHQLGRLEWPYQAIHGVSHDEIASPEEAELSPKSTQLFHRKTLDKYKSSLVAMTNAKALKRT